MRNSSAAGPLSGNAGGPDQPGEPTAAREQVDAGPPFFVGYRPIPAGLRLYLRRVTVVLLAAAAGVALVMSRTQPDPGSGVWLDGQVRTWSGLVSARPYPLLWAYENGVENRLEPLLLVEIGKFGGGQRVADGLDGTEASISGYLLERDGRRMIEIESSGAAVSAAGAGNRRPVALPEPEVLGHFCLRGEIVDSKCYFGAMKPGEGKTHKECATLCVAGGIPPMLVTLGAAGREYYLLSDEEGGPVGDWLLPLVADPVEIDGVLVRWGELRLLRVSPAGVRRL